MDDDLNQLIVRLNTQYRGRLKIFGLLSEPPVIAHQETFVVPEDMHFAYCKNKIRLAKRNEMHAVYWGGLHNISPEKENSLNCQLTDYAACRTYRVDYQKCFPLITGNALVLNAEKNAFIMQKRSEQSDWNPGAYSVFGGGYSPIDQHSILQTIYREFNEETNGQVWLRECVPYTLLTQELKAGSKPTGSIQFTILGAEVGYGVPLLNQNGGNEGNVAYIPVETVGQHQKNNTWTALAEVSVLIWQLLQIKASNN